MKDSLKDSELRMLLQEFDAAQTWLRVHRAEEINLKPGELLRIISSAGSVKKGVVRYVADNQDVDDLFIVHTAPHAEPVSVPILFCRRLPMLGIFCLACKLEKTKRTTSISTISTLGHGICDAHYASWLSEQIVPGFGADEKFWHLSSDEIQQMKKA